MSGRARTERNILLSQSRVSSPVKISHGALEEDGVALAGQVKRRQAKLATAKPYALAVLLVAVAIVLRWGLGFLTLFPKLDLQAFTTLYPAVLISALVGGAGPGIFAALLGGAISWWLFLAPYGSLSMLSTGDAINLLTYLIASGAIVWATDHYRRLTERLSDEERLRRLAVEELAHRLKNKVASIQSIINFRLRDYPQIRGAIIGSLAALMAVDDLIIAAQGKGASIRDILAAELAPYDRSRVSMSGPDCFLASNLALTMALVLHELATNAAKYGALSNSDGAVSIDWSAYNDRLALSWQESQGPVVSPPGHKGFGTRLFQRALKQFDGDMEVTFSPSGLVCKLSVRLPEQ